MVVIHSKTTEGTNEDESGDEIAPHPTVGELRDASSVRKDPLGKIDVRRSTRCHSGLAIKIHDGLHIECI